jgi:hypothetical protein
MGAEMIFFVIALVLSFMLYLISYLTYSHWAWWLILMPFWVWLGCWVGIILTFILVFFTFKGDPLDEYDEE